MSNDLLPPQPPRDPDKAKGPAKRVLKGAG